MAEPEKPVAPGVSPEVLELQKLGKAGKFDDLESAWMVAVEGGEVSVDDFMRVLANLDKGADPKRRESLLWFMLTGWTEKRGSQEGLTAAKLAANVFPQSAILRDELSALYRQAHAVFPGIETLTEMTVLAKEVALPQAIDQMERLLALAPGTYVMDTRRRAPGKVVGADAAKKALVVAFEDRERTFDAQTIENLELVDPDDFRALAVFVRPRLEALAQDDPAELVRLALKVYGPQLTFKELKARLAPAVSAEGWSKWWSGAKLAVRQSPALELSEGTQPTFTLRMKPLSYEDAVRGRFDAAPAGEARLLVALAYLAETAGTGAADVGVLRPVAEALARELREAAESDPAAAIGTLTVLGEIRKRAADAVPEVPVTLEALLARTTDLPAILGSVRSSDLAMCILTMIREALPDKWPEVYVGAMPGCAADICDWMAGALAEQGHTAFIAEAAAAALRKPERHAAALVWLWRAAAADRYPEVVARLDLVALAMGILKAATALARRGTPPAKELLAQVRSAVSAKDFALLRKVIPMAEQDRAKDLRHIVDRNAGLSDSARVVILEIVHSAHPSLFAKPLLAPWEDGDVIYTTEAALKRYQKEFEHLANVKMVENARAIGAAAEHGDISDNAEFTAAMEERDRLAAKAAQMRADLAKARPITGSMAAGDNVNVGSAVKARNLATGQTRTFVLLGPWDADLEKGIYSYRAALSQAFMGKRVGDTVTLPGEDGETEWEILAVEPGLGHATDTERA